ncbi:MAG: DNA polymerase I [Bacillota bacterium]
MKSQKEEVIIIDGNSIINRAFYGVPTLVNKDGIHTNAVYGFFNMFFKMLKTHDPDYISVAFDVRADTFRHKEYKEYKANRSGMPDELAQQMPIIKDILTSLGIHTMELEGYEADDLLGTVSNICADKGFHVNIVSGDKDILQLVTENIHVLYSKSGSSNLIKYEIEDVKEDFGVLPKYIPDYKGLCGDSADNIPGVAGIGKKTAKKVLNQFDTIEKALDDVENIKSTRARKRLKVNGETALLSKKLATIVKNVPIEFSIRELKKEEINTKKVIDLLKKYELNSIIKRIKKFENVPFEKLDIKINEISTKKVKEKLKEIDEFSFKLIYDKIDIFENNLISMAISTKSKNYFINLKNDENDLIDLKEVFEDENIKKIGFSLKDDYLLLLQIGINLKGVCFDSYIADYLIEPSTSNYLISNIVMKHFTRSIKSKEELLGKGRSKKDFEQVDIEKIKDYNINISYYSYKLRDILKSKLKDESLYEIFKNVEMPLIKVLAEIEFKGFNVDKEKLDEIDQNLTQKIDSITKKIYKLAGEEFNINSPKQLGVILFEKLDLPVIKKTKTGYSTAKSVLKKLMDKHEIIPLIKEYRTYSKLKSTYIDGLFKVINEKSNRIHTSLNQTVTVTGRLSSSDPNLQNIPVRLPIGRKIRKVFVPSDGNILLGADYSQIELRVLAHMSKDEKLLHAYNNGIDIHKLTASEVFHKKLEDVTSAERRKAKEVNFGIVYGMSDHGLSDRLEISRKEAKTYIEKYFNTYKGVKKYMDNVVKQCKEKHYVKTILNRKRYIREINDKNYFKRQFAERTAKNTPIQGSAADIIKIAMINTNNALKEAGLKSEMILQVHDELLIDVIPNELDKVKEILLKEMEDAYSLDVPLVVDMKTGKSWYETK